MPDRVYLFDVDGTLTRPLTEVNEVFAEVFLSWIRNNAKKVYLVENENRHPYRDQIRNGKLQYGWPRRLPRFARSIF